MQDHIVRVGARARALGVVRLLECVRHPKKRGAARACERAAAPCRDVGDAEALGKDPRREVVQISSTGGNLANESALEGGRHPNQDSPSVRTASSQTASTLARAQPWRPQ